MLKNKLPIFTSIFILTTMWLSNAHALPQFGVDPIEDVIKSMTLEEKARLVVGPSTMNPLPPPPAPGTPEKVVKESGPNTFESLNRVKGAAGHTYAIPRLNIPTVVFADGPAGVRISPNRDGDNKSYYATAFPISTLLASTWDLAQIERVGQAMGNEVLEYGVDVLLAPGINIHRNPLTGRNFEYYSEDPYVAGKAAAAMINGIQSNGVGTSLKHYAANNQETFRNGINAIVSERTLREIYLRGFEIAVEESHPWTVMSSYNKVNGEYASESKKLLTNILRDQFKFNGFVMTDWWAANDPIAQMKAGNDMLMPGHESQVQDILKAVASGDLSETILDRNVKNILSVFEKTPIHRNYKNTNSPDLALHSILAREVAAEGMVLLENRNKALPLSSEEKNIALIGVGSYRPIIGGHGSGYVYYPYKISLEKGLLSAGWKAERKIADRYNTFVRKQLSVLPKENFWEVPVVPEMELSSTDIDSLANETDAAILTLNRNSGEGSDRTLDKGDYYLTDYELDLIKKVSRAFKTKNKKFVVVLNVGGVIEMTDWKDYPDAILLAWQPGLEAGNAIADVLTGKVTPSGKLPMTFPKRYSDVPSSNNFPWSDNSHARVQYDEGIFVGYRHYSTHKVQPLYEFGYGLSYTEFDYSKPSIKWDKSKKSVLISVTIKNIGNTSGKEIAQVYSTPPVGTLSKPIIELKAFGKTKLLQPGESERLSFTIKNKFLSSYDEAHSVWMTDGGEYLFSIGSSSSKVRLTEKIQLKQSHFK